MIQMSLFNQPTPVLPVTYYPEFLSQEEAGVLYQHCLKLQWQQNQIKMVGKTLLVPRLECIYGDEGCEYLYSKSVLLKPLPWTEALADSNFNAEQHLRSDPEISKPQKNTAVGEVKDEEVEESEYEPVRQAPKPEQPEITHFVDEQELDNSTGEIDSHEDEFSESKVEVDSSTYKPSKHEIAEVCTELRRLRINPEPCLGVVKKYWANVPGAIARIKEALQTWQSVKSPTGVFITACKEGKKPQNTATADIIAWYEWAKNKRIVAAMSGKVVYTPSGEPVDLQQMMQLYPCEYS